jgi:glutathione S-transferase
MKLIGSLTSPYVRKVRIVMAEKKLDYQLVLEDVWSADTQMAICVSADHTSSRTNW